MTDSIEINGKEFVFRPLKMKQKFVVSGLIATILKSLQAEKSDIDMLKAYEVAKIVFKHGAIDGFEIIVTDDGIEEAFGGDFSFMMAALIEAGKVNFPDLFGKAEALAKNSDSALGKALKDLG